MVDFNALSRATQQEVSSIMAMGGDTGKIDTRAEYDKLSELLAGGKVSGQGEKDFIEELMFRYEESDLVSPQIRERIRGIVKNTDATRADDNLEKEDLKKLLKTKGLSNEDKKYIKDVLNGKAISIETSAKTAEKKPSQKQSTPIQEKPKANTQPDAKKKETIPSKENTQIGSDNCSHGNDKGNVGNGNHNVGHAGRDVNAGNGAAIGNGNKTSVGNNTHQYGTGNVNGDNNSVNINSKTKKDDTLPKYFGLH